MYIEFFILIFDYFKTLTKRIALFEVGLPFLLVLSLFFLNTDNEFVSYKAFKDNSLNILSVLLGFSITVITIITTGSGKNIEDIKSIKTDFKIGNKQISLYELLIINFTYSVVIEILVIVGCLSFPLFSSCISFNNLTKSLLYLGLIYTIIHIMLLTIRNLTDFYLIITKKYNVA